MDQAWSTLAFFLIFLLVSTKLFLQKTQRKKLPPSPPSLPIIGHLHLIKEPLQHSLDSLSKQYGPILFLRFGSRPVCVISSPSAIEELYTKNDVVFANRPFFLIAKHINYNHTTAGAAPYGHHWRKLRSLTALEFFSSTRLNMSSGVRREEIKLLLGKLFQNSRDRFVKVEMKSRLSELSFNILTRMIVGERYFGENVGDFEEARKFRHIIEEIFEMSGASNLGDFLPILHWIDYQGFEKKLLSLGRQVDAFLGSLIDKHRNSHKTHFSFSTSEAQTNRTLIDVLLPLQETEPEYYTDEIIKGIFLDLLFAGTDTTSGTIEWALSHLLNHTEVLKKARAELDTYVGHERLVDELDLPKLHYLQNIIHETLRLTPPSPLLLPHESSDDSTIGGFDIQRGTILFVNAWAIHRDPNLWDDPLSFKPERFEGAKGQPYQMLPFGLGRRGCPAVALANRVVGLALGTLIQCFEWERVNEEEVDMTEGIGFTMPKAKPLEALCKGRPTMNSILSEL